MTHLGQRIVWVATTDDAHLLTSQGKQRDKRECEQRRLMQRERKKKIKNLRRMSGKVERLLVLGLGRQLGAAARTNRPQPCPSTQVRNYPLVQPLKFCARMGNQEWKNWGFTPSGESLECAAALRGFITLSAPMSALTNKSIFASLP